ncbi:hypothetical protein [Listeria fleischmannii]|uniref:DUF4145 domain-containing protein n=1 Tax=Listeria fleischmannii FSL S10-1203 TaxID=1265822 RepID=W7DAT9_9LIST|nr:hypothetical protein [Listeria fleischmannii]EUJ46195.1 hypothetical protein MCOL2_19069 [Listeria fleischmannii FSL S10-1203]
MTIRVFGHIKDAPHVVHNKFEIPNINYEKGIDFEVILEYDSIDQDAMPISESQSIVINAVNRKYKTDFSFRSYFPTLKIRKFFSLDSIDDLLSQIDDEDFTYQLKEATQAYDHNLFLAAAATYSVALETLCLLILEKETHTDINQLDSTELGYISNLLKKQSVISKKDKERIMATSKIRNFSSHSNIGINTQNDCDLLVATIEYLINKFFTHGE